MKVNKTKLKDCLIIQPEIFEDERGFFLETYHKKRYEQYADIKFSFVQDNHSRSSRGVLRGLHFQKKKPQGKLVRVTKGKVFDVAVDIRKQSITYGKWQAVILSEDNKTQFWIPPGFAHGFCVLSDYADFEYKCTDFYDPLDEECIRWNDSSINIAWPIENPIISKKDLLGKNLEDI